MRHMKVPIFLACLCIVVAVSTSPALDFPNLNPFKKKEDLPRSAYRTEGLSPFSRNNSQAKDEPGAFQKFNQGTRNFLRKTGDVLTPWDNNKNKRAQPQSITGARGGSRSGVSFSRDDQKQDKNWVARLMPWDSKPKKEPINDVNDFLKQPRPKFR